MEVLIKLLATHMVHGVVDRELLHNFPHISKDISSLVHHHQSLLDMQLPHKAWDILENL